MKVFVRLSAVVALAVALAVAVFGAAGSSAKTSHLKAHTKASQFTLGIVADTGGLNDHGFNHLAYEGSIEAHKHARRQDPGHPRHSRARDYVPLLTEEARAWRQPGRRCRLRLHRRAGPGRQAVPEDALRDHRLRRPRRSRPTPKNVEGLTFLSQQSGYLVGYLSGLISKAKGYTTISSVGGQNIPSVTAYIAGYQQGGKAADPGLKFLNGFSQNFTDPADCETIANNQISQGSKIVFQVAGGCGLGALQARQAARRLRDRRRRRPGLPGLLHPDLGAQEGRRRGGAGRSIAAARPLRRRRRPGLLGRQRRHRLRQARHGRASRTRASCRRSSRDQERQDQGQPATSRG